LNPLPAAADVLTIENARSDDAMIKALRNAGYSRDLGAGVYDVHSPVIPTVDFMASKVQNFVNTGILDKDARRIWVNPDCGLKTRAWKEVVPSLKNMVDAAKVMRAVTAA
jgi:5-methyltetrahydropteroyltriglutamate--homocysteine methyltransferase